MSNHGCWAITQLRRCYCCRCRVLAVELVDESPRDVDALGCVNNRNLTTVYDDGDATGLGENFECFADVLLQRQEDVLASFVVSGLGVLALSFQIGIELFELIPLCPDGIRIRDGLRIVDLFGQRSDSLLQILQLSLSRLKFPVQRAEQAVESRNAGLRIEKRIRIDHCDLAIRHRHGGLLSGGRGCGRGWFLLC